MEFEQMVKDDLIVKKTISEVVTELFGENVKILDNMSNIEKNIIAIPKR